MTTGTTKEIRTILGHLSNTANNFNTVSNQLKKRY
jgi:hypothetical protein